MRKNKCALLDTDFISKLHITRRDDNNRMIDRILEMEEYQFCCHEQITIELGRHNSTAKQWLQEKIQNGTIKKYRDIELVYMLQLYGKNAIMMYLSFLKQACDAFKIGLYELYYKSLENQATMENFSMMIEVCDGNVGKDNNLGEIKTYTMQKIIEITQNMKVYLFCSDDKKARAGLYGSGAVSCISGISAFYVLKNKLKVEKEEARIYFDSWMRLHQQTGQSTFKIHRATKAMQLVTMDGYEIFERIYNNSLSLLKNGNLKEKE